MIKHKHSFVICYILPKLLYQNCGFGTFGIQRMYLKTLLSYGWYWILFRASLHSFCLWSKETFIPALGPWVIKANSRSLQNQKQTSDFFFSYIFLLFFFYYGWWSDRNRRGVKSHRSRQIASGCGTHHLNCLHMYACVYVYVCEHAWFCCTWSAAIKAYYQSKNIIKVSILNKWFY